MGESKVQIFEVESPGEVNTININGKNIKFKSLPIQKSANSGVKSYIVIEKYNNLDLTTIDIVYGVLDLELLKKDEKAREDFFEKILTRKNIELITRKYCGVLPILSRDGFGNESLIMDEKVVMAVARSVLDEAYLETRTSEVNINNNMFGNNRKKVTMDDIMGTSKHKAKKAEKSSGFFSRIFGKEQSDEEHKEENQTTETNNISPYEEERRTYTENKGVLFYRSGVVILGKEKCLKFNYATKDYTTKNSKTNVERTETNSFLISEFDEERLKYDDEYRKKFVSEILEPSRLNNARRVNSFPYIGKFVDSGKYESDVEIWAAFSKISESFER